MRPRRIMKIGQRIDQSRASAGIMPKFLIKKIKPAKTITNPSSIFFIIKIL